MRRQSSPSHQRATPRSDRVALYEGAILVGKAVAGGQVVGPLVEPENERAFRRTQARRRSHQCIEHSLQIKGRAADHLEHFGGGSLLLTRLVQLAREPSD